MFKSNHTTIIANIQKSLGIGSGWIIVHTISISKYNSLAGNSYIKLMKLLDHPSEGLINTQNIDNECFKWCLVRYLNPADHNAGRITKADKDFAKKLDFKDIIFPVKIGDIHKIEKRIPLALVFLTLKIKKNIQSMYQNNAVKKNMLIYC